MNRPLHRGVTRWAAALGLASLAAAPAWAARLEVGPGRAFPTPSAAIAAAQDGDTVAIAAGSYFDCAIVTRNRLVIEGEGDATVLTDRACQDKAILVIQADAVTIRRLTLARSRVPDGNGAGIRLEQPSLTVQSVWFQNDQVGLLASAPGGEIRIEDSRFSDGGVGGERPLYAVMAPAAALLQVKGCSFRDVAGGQISSGAARTELVGNEIGAGHGEAPGNAVWVAGGALLMQDNTIRVGPGVLPRNSAVMLLDDASATLRGNRLINESGQPMVLLRDWSNGSPVLEGNVLAAGDEAVSDGGITRHRLSTTAHGAADDLRHTAGRMRRALRSLW